MHTFIIPACCDARIEAKANQEIYFLGMRPCHPLYMHLANERKIKPRNALKNAQELEL
jgi:hypothetical protein